MQKKVLLIIFTLIMSILTMFGMDKNKDEKKILLPDFNFPQDVIKDSEDQLKNALSHGD
mgnify:CR=1 FL=1